MGLFRTIDVIVGSPVRSRLWKVVDVTFLCVLWTATIVSVLASFGDPWSTWDIIVRIIVPVTLLATARSWYAHPKLSKRAREKAARCRALEANWSTPLEHLHSSSER